MAVVGAGMVGLSTAWFLQEYDVEVTVFDQVAPGAGASWGNAGWITPSLSTPLPEPSMLAYGLRRLASPTSPLYIPPRLDPGLWGFLARFARHSTASRWRAGVGKMVAVNRLALPAFDALAAGGVDGPIAAAEPFVIAYTNPGGPAAMVGEAAELAALGQPVDVEQLSASRARALVPMLSEEIRGAVLLGGQRFLDPPGYVAALAQSVVARGGRVRARAEVARIRDEGAKVRLTGPAVSETFDAVAVATGAGLRDLAAPFGVRTRMRAGRGYSFSVVADTPPAGPVYFPGNSVVATPLGDRLRIAGMMEFRPHGAPIDPRRISAIVESVRPLIRGVDLDDRRDEWVGSRPCTADGLPLAGPTRSPRVFVAGGHAMEGMTLGPVTGMLVAQNVATGTVPAPLAGFDPVR